MIIVKPETVTAAKLISSNVPATDNPAWSSATAYTTGNLVMFNNRNYEALQPSTNKQPDLFPLFWLDRGAINRFRLFDGIVGNSTTNPNTIDVTIRPGTIVNAIALFGIVAASIRVVMTDPTAGVVYDQTINLVDLSGITSHFAYFFNAVGERREDYVFLDLPQFAAADIRVLIDNTGGTAETGELVMGAQRMLGTSNYGTQIGIRDYSRKEVNEFGDFVVVQRRFSKTCDYAVTLETANLASIQRYLASIRAAPCVFIGDPARDETVLYGFYQDFQTVISAPSVSDCTLRVEGLT